uniref:N-terminal methionine N(alpha)-acetyltransferase NatC n=1 Tax=Angiostrongylus cantonensis TaxID=6313 RepID=A0A158P732_ANGCA
LRYPLFNEESKGNERAASIILVDYKDENQIGDIMRLITKDLSEPYSIYTYRYFIHNWPELCILAYDTISEVYVGAVVCKLDRNAEGRRKGYLAMLAIDESCRKLGLGTRLVRRAIERMQAQGCDEVVLETEVLNVNAQRLYNNLGFIREKRLMRYYLNGGDAFRLKLFLSPPVIVVRKSSFVSTGSQHEK